MKFRVAFLVNLGSIVAWFFLVPLVVIQDVPVYDPSLGAYVNITDYSDSSSSIFYPTIQWKAFSSVVRTIAIGAILGGGMFGLVKMAPTFISLSLIHISEPTRPT